MFVFHIDLEQPHLNAFYTKKYFNKKNGTKLRSIKKMRAYERQMFKRKMTENFEILSKSEIRPMAKPSDIIYYMETKYQEDLQL